MQPAADTLLARDAGASLANLAPIVPTPPPERFCTWTIAKSLEVSNTQAECLIAMLAADGLYPWKRGWAPRVEDGRDPPYGPRVFMQITIAALGRLDLVRPNFASCPARRRVVLTEKGRQVARCLVAQRGTALAKALAKAFPEPSFSEQAAAP